MCLNRKDLGLLALRSAVGGVLIAHGTQKLFGWFGGGGLEGTTQAMDHMGFHPARESAIAAGVGEAGGGAVVAGTMAGAVAVHAPAGFFAMSGGYEYPAFLGATGLAIGLAGPGRYSLDHLTGHVFDRSWVGLLAFVGSAAGAYGVVARRRHLVRLREERAAVEAEQQEGSGLS